MKRLMTMLVVLTVTIAVAAQGYVSTENLQQSCMTKDIKMVNGCKITTKLRKDENGQCDAILLTCETGVETQLFTCELIWPKDEDYLGEGGTILQEDINFDGLPDLLVCLGNFSILGDSPNIFYAGFLWNSRTCMFDPVKNYGQVVNPVVDAQRKVIVSEYTTVDGEMNKDIYRWQGEELILSQE